MLNRDDAIKICETVLAHAKAAGAEDASVSLSDSVESHARLADNRVTTSGRADDIDITATVWVGKRRGATTVNDSSAAALQQLANDAVQIARLSPVQREYVPTLGPLQYGDDRGYAAATANLDLAARAKSLQAVLDSCRAQKVTGAGFHTTRVSATAAATANGNRRYFRSTRADFSVTARTPDGTGSGYFSGDHFDISRLDVPHIATQAINKAITSRQPQPIEPGNYPVILEPQAVADLIGTLTGAFDARSAEEGRSAFSARDGKTRLGEQMFNDRINLYSDPANPVLPAAPVTDEGIPAARLSLIKGGVIENFRYTRYWAEQKKRDATPGPVNYILDSTQPPTPIDEMIKGMQRGLLISRFWYVRLVDPRTLVLTGLTRDGLWWIENGQVKNPVRNLRFNQSVLGMLAPRNVEAIGTPQRLAPYVVPALRLGSFTFTSVSDAI
jgi:predicted Zn-dependent protease